MHLTENGYFKHKGLSWFIDFLEFLIIIIFSTNKAAGAANMNSSEMMGFMFWLIL